MWNLSRFHTLFWCFHIWIWTIRCWLGKVQSDAMIRGGSTTAATSKVELFVIIVNGWKPLTIITKSSTLDVAAVIDPTLMIMSKKKKKKKKIWVFYHEHSGIIGKQGKKEALPLIPSNQFHSLNRRLDINRAIATDSSPLQIASGRTRTGNTWFPSTSG